MLDVMYDTFAENTEKLEKYLKDYDASVREIKKIIDDIPVYWVSKESESYYNRFKKVKNDKKALKELAAELSVRMRELSDAFKVVVDVRVKEGKK